MLKVDQLLLDKYRHKDNLISLHKFHHLFKDNHEMTVEQDENKV